MHLKPLVQVILEGYALPRHGTHGVGHWGRVLENGLRLAAGTGVNPEIVSLFAVFHDARRINEGGDHGHGRRGAELAEELRGTLFELPDDDFLLLRLACEGHTDGLTEADLAVQVCWDADRLDLPRVGKTVDPARLCTAAAKSPEMIEWASGRAACRSVPQLVESNWGLVLAHPRR
ncbi:MAG: HD domain-containing protein [Armatimonadota bacterium]